MTAGIRGFDAAQHAHDSATPPEPREPFDGMLPDEDALHRMGYSVEYTIWVGWRLHLDEQHIGDGYRDAAAAWDAAAEHWRESQPEWCERCGDQAVCAECRA